MNEKSDFVYIIYPVPVDMLRDLPLPFIKEEPPRVPLTDDDSFMPYWYGNARFPEDDV